MRTLITGLGCWLLVATLAVADEGRYHLELRGTALGTAAAEEDEGGAAAGAAGVQVFVLERQRDAWFPTFASDAPFARGVIRSASRTGAQWQVVADVLTGEPGRRRDWHKSQMLLGEYRFTFQAVAGKITGTWEGPAGKGALAGNVAPLRAWELPAAAQAGEHPRFLLRKEDLPALKAKAQTEWGKAMLKQMAEPGWSRSGTAVAQGLLYQLTGERRYADQARQLIADDMRSGWWQAIGPIHDPAHKATEAMFAYDLVHDTYSPAEHAKLRAFLREKLQFMFNYAEINSGNSHPHSNWSAQYRAGVGMVALALLADPAAELPATMAWEPVKVAPVTSGEGPVLPLNDAPLRKWLYTGPLNMGLEYDPTPALAGTPFKMLVKEKPRADQVSGRFRQAIEFKNARPSVPNKGTLGDDLQPLTKEVTVTYQPIPEKELIAANEYVEKFGAPGQVHLWRAAGLQGFQTIFFRAIIENPVGQYVQVRLTSTSKNDDWRYLNSCLYISGQKFTQSGILWLEPGRHPVVRQVTVCPITTAHVRHHLYDEVWLRPVGAEIVAQARAVRHAEAEFRRRVVAAVKPRYAELGRPDIDALIWLPVARGYMERYATIAISERGWHSAGQCYTQHPLLVALPFFHAWRNATGTEVTASPNLGWYLGQATARTVFSDEWARMQDYGRGGGPVGVDLFGRGLASVPPAIRGAVFAAWQKTRALTDAKKFSAPEGAVETLDPMSAAFTLVNWPGDGRAGGLSLPKAIVDSQRLGYTMRNRWQDGDDIAAVFTGFRHPGGDWVCEGAPLDLRLQGLGVEWLVRGNSIVTGMTSTVALEGVKTEPQDVTQRSCATAADGSAIVTLAHKMGLRSFAVDYSGASGAPALFVLADKITYRPAPARKPAAKPVTKDDVPGEPPRESLRAPPHRWRLVTDAGNQVAVEPGGFTITGPNGATLRGTIIAPAKATPTVADATHNIEINYRFDHINGSFTRKVISVAGDDNFLVVFTLQKGAAPPVTVEGDTVRLGQQTVRFDGEKIVLGRFAGAAPPPNARPTSGAPAGTAGSP